MRTLVTVSSEHMSFSHSNDVSVLRLTIFPHSSRGIMEGNEDGIWYLSATDGNIGHFVSHTNYCADAHWFFGCFFDIGCHLKWHSFPDHTCNPKVEALPAVTSAASR